MDIGGRPGRPSFLTWSISYQLVTREVTLSLGSSFFPSIIKEYMLLPHRVAKAKPHPPQWLVLSNT